MAYNDDAVLARLSSLNESHDSIATAAQWIMFHRYGGMLGETRLAWIFRMLTRVVFRRHADRTVQLWMQRLKDSSSPKRLTLIYLANGKFLRSTCPSCSLVCVANMDTEVTQQSRIRHKEDFVIAFSPVIAEAASIAYKGASAEIQTKIRRVVDVWRDRTIFEAPIQGAIYARLDGMRKIMQA